MTHIKHDDNRAWCGLKLGNSFHFKDVDQVLINSTHGERIPCPYCLNAIVRKLQATPAKAQLTGTALTAIISH